MSIGAERPQQSWTFAEHVGVGLAEENARAAASRTSRNTRIRVLRDIFHLMNLVLGRKVPVFFHHLLKRRSGTMIQIRELGLGRGV